MRSVKLLLNKLLYSRKKDKSYLNEHLNSYNFTKPIFIWGCPRSGTTLMQHVLSLSPEIITLRREQKSEDSYNLKEGTYIWWDIIGFKRAELNFKIKPKHIEKIKKKYIFEAGLKNSKKRFLDKNIFLMLWIDKIDKFFPDAFHIHMIRNGLAVANSHLFKYRFSERKKDKPYRERLIPIGPYSKELKKYFNKDITEFFAKQWNFLISKGRSWERLLKERYIEVFYEDLTKNPQKTLKRVCDKIEINSNQIIIDIAILDMNFKYKEDKFKAETYTMKRSIKKSDLQKLNLIKETMEELGYNFDIIESDL